jgi:hypothetical protein
MTERSQRVTIERHFWLLPLPIYNGGDTLRLQYERLFTCQRNLQLNLHFRFE